ncbi:MAG: asparagine synthase (glutamine-hydrolyzing) [Acidobacteria bacterium]|nr:MAG: asparagine synthase (glutamine-hydrolyzing) [Acidobacteriota bacterium]
MCGIAGVLYHDLQARADRASIEAMNQAMVHRGPDDGGIHLDGPVGLGHRRLSIIDRAAGHQPMSNEDDTVWISFNGEIYNYREVRRTLVARGHTFKTQGDTEVILHLYEDEGERCVEKLTGMFAFAIWDRSKSTLLLARDRLGIKPLYYFVDGRMLAFGSEIKALLSLGSIEPRLDMQALHDYLTFHYNVAPQTMIKGIYKLPPGHILVAQNGTVRQEQYWDLDYSKKLDLTEAECIEEFRRRVLACTESHLVGEVPLGVLLSGGLDSTTIAAAMAELGVRRIKTFTVAFDGEKAADYENYDERGYARLAARHYGADHHEIAITQKDFAGGLRDYVWHMDEPMADSASIPLYYVSRLAKDHVTVILSGEGSDELLAGYNYWASFKGFERARWFRRIPGPIRNHLLAPANRRWLRSRRLQRYLELANRPLSHYPMVIPDHMGLFSEDAKLGLYGPRAGRSDTFTRSEEVVVDAYQKTTSFPFLDQMLYVSTKQWLPDDLLLKADKMTMAHSLELRVPFLDHTLVEFAASLPVDMKVRRNGGPGYTTKYVLRKAFGRSVPPDILRRKKLGFPVPLKSLLRGELKTMTLDMIHSRSFAERGVFDRPRVLSLLREHDAGLDRGPQLWALLVFSMWADVFGVVH